MADGKITREETFDSGIKKEIQDITSEFKNLVDELTKVTKILSEFRAETSNTTKSAAELNKIENEAKEIIDKISVAEQNLTTKKKELNLEQEKQKKANKEANDIAKLNATINDKEAGAIEKLKAQIKLLYIEKSKLKESDKDFLKNIDNYNKKIGDQEKALSKLKSTTEKQRDNIGNYKSALEGLSPQFGKVSSEASKFGGILTKLGPVGIAALSAIALVGAPLVAFFTQSEQGADLLERKVSGLKASFGILANELINLGSGIEKSDKGSIKWGTSLKPIVYLLTGIAALIPGVRDKISDIANKMDDASKTAEEATRKMQDLEDMEIGMIVRRATANEKLINARLLSSDEEIDIKKRIEYFKEAFKLENETADEEIKHQEHIVEVLKQRAILLGGQLQANGEILKGGRYTREEERKLNEAIAKTIDLRGESERRQTRGQRMMRSLIKQDIENEKKLIEDKLIFELSLIIDEQQKEEAELKRKYTKDLETAKKYGIDLTSVTDKYNSDLAGIRKKYDDKKKAEDEKAQKEIEDQAKALIDSAKNAYQRKFEIAKDSGDKIDEYEDASLGLELQNMKTLIDSMQVDNEIKRQMLDEYYKYEAQLNNESAENTKRTEEEKKQAIEQNTQAAIDLVNNLANLYGALNDRQIQGIETKTDKQLTDLEKEKKARIKSGQDETKVDEDISRRKEELEKKRAIEIAKIQRKQAIADKAAGIFSATINTAKAVTAALPNIFLSILVGLAGALEIATIAAQPLPEIPAFKKGGKVKKTGVIKYGEEGSELITLPSGEQYLSPSVPTLAMLPQGTDIKPTDLTQQILQDSIYKINLNAEKKDENQILNEINKTLKGLKQVNVNVDKWGFRISATEGASRTKYLNEKFRC
jgi:hypothetical protein